MQDYKDIDDYITRAPDRNRSILVELRRIFQKASPKLEEAIKWGVPCFVYKGPVGAFTSYKNHVSWGLWKSRALKDPYGLLGHGIMAGGKMTTVAEIPPASKMIDLIRQVIVLNEGDIQPVTPTPEPPADFIAALKGNDSAAIHFAAFTPARQWQYVNWINKAKRAETRVRRIETAILRIGVGKPMK